MFTGFTGFTGVHQLAAATSMANTGACLNVHASRQGREPSGSMPRRLQLRARLGRAFKAFPGGANVHGAAHVIARKNVASLTIKVCNEVLHPSVRELFRDVLEPVATATDYRTALLEDDAATSFLGCVGAAQFYITAEDAELTGDQEDNLAIFVAQHLVRCQAASSPATRWVAGVVPAAVLLLVLQSSSGFPSDELVCLVDLNIGVQQIVSDAINFAEDVAMRIEAIKIGLAEPHTPAPEQPAPEQPKSEEMKKREAEKKEKEKHHEKMTKEVITSLVRDSPLLEFGPWLEEKLRAKNGTAAHAAAINAAYTQMVQVQMERRTSAAAAAQAAAAAAGEVGGSFVGQMAAYLATAGGGVTPKDLLAALHRCVKSSPQVKAYKKKMSCTYSALQALTVGHAGTSLLGTTVDSAVQLAEALMDSAGRDGVRPSADQEGSLDLCAAVIQQLRFMGPNDDNFAAVANALTAYNGRCQRAGYDQVVQRVNTLEGGVDTLKGGVDTLKVSVDSISKRQRLDYADTQQQADRRQEQTEMRIREVAEEMRNLMSGLEDRLMGKRRAGPLEDGDAVHNHQGVLGGANLEIAQGPRTPVHASPRSGSATGVMLGLERLRVDTRALAVMQPSALLRPTSVPKAASQQASLPQPLPGVPGSFKLRPTNGAGDSVAPPPSLPLGMTATAASSSTAQRSALGACGGVGSMAVSTARWHEGSASSSGSQGQTGMPGSFKVRPTNAAGGSVAPPPPVSQGMAALRHGGLPLPQPQPQAQSQPQPQPQVELMHRTWQRAYKEAAEEEALSQLSAWKPSEVGTGETTEQARLRFTQDLYKLCSSGPDQLIAMGQLMGIGEPDMMVPVEEYVLRFLDKAADCNEYIVKSLQAAA